MEDKKQIYEVLEERAFKELEEYEQEMLQKDPCEIYDACYDIVFYKEMRNYIVDELSEHFEEEEIESLRNESPLLEGLLETWKAITEEARFDYQEMREVLEAFIEEKTEE